MRTLPVNLGAALALQLVLTGTVAAQSPDSDTTAASAQQPVSHHRHRARRTRHAQPDSTTLLQVEASYDGDFDSPDLSRDQSSTVSLIVTPHPRVEFQADMDFWASQKSPGLGSVPGHGDTRLTGQWTLLTAAPARAAVGLAYEVKLPTASPASLGSGRVDHRALLLLSHSAGKLEIDLTGGVDADGRAGGLEWGVEGAGTLTVMVHPGFSVQTGGSGQTIDADQPAGLYAYGGMAWQILPALALDIGARAGLSSRTPAYGITGGVTVPVLRP
jgi:hypothetical protein